jgi:hypothetical protein
MEIDWVQATEEEAREIAYRNGRKFRIEDLPLYRYASRKSIEDLKKETPFLP